MLSAPLQLISTKHLLLPLIIAAIASATLLPTDTPGHTPRIHWEITGLRSLADAVANILLFVPLGVAAAARFKSWRSALYIGVLLSLAIEVAQLVVPGRYTSALDVTFNAVGTGLGAAAIRTAGVWLRPTAGIRLSLAAVCMAAGLGAVVCGALLFTPSRSSAPAFVEWTPELRNYRYAGRVLAASIGTRSLQSGRTAPWSELITSYLGTTDTIRIVLTAAAPTREGASILRIVDKNSTELVGISAVGTDLVFRYRMRASVLHLDQPEVHGTDMLRGLASGERFVIEVWRSGDKDCLSVRTNRVCAGLTIGETWALLFFPVPRELSLLLTLTWLVVLFAPAAFWIERRSVLLGAVALVALVLLGAPRFLPLSPTPTAQLLAAAAGLTSGHVLGLRVRHGHREPTRR